MSEGRVLTLDVSLERGEVLRLLGYRRGATPAPALADRIDSLWAAAVELLTPRGVYVMLERDEARAVGLPEPQGTVAVALCTIGADLEHASREAGRRDRPLDALVFDAVGSAAAEAAADALNHTICARLRALGAWPAPRVSPGYGKWQVTSQPALLARLPADEVGVQLTSGGMMNPQKSVSFAVHWLSEPPGEAARVHRCARCGFVDCRHRVEAPSS